MTNHQGAFKRSLLSAVALVLAGCSHFQQRLFIDPKLEANAIAVYPFGFRWPESAYRSFELSQRLIEVVIDKAGDDALVFGPSDFRVYQPQEDSWAGSNAVGLFPAYHLSAQKALILRPWAEQRRFQSQRDVTDAKGKHVGTKTVVDITYVGHVEIVHPYSRQVLVDESGEAQVDPFADHTDDPDPAPELTQLMRALTADALAAVSDHLKAPSKPADFDVKYELVPNDVYTFAEKDRPELEKELSKLDPVEADVVRLNRVRYANPKVPDAEAAKLVKLPGGLYLTAVGGGFKARVGDLIHLIDGRPATPQGLQRARFAQSPVQVRIQRTTGISQEITLP